jgi:hypothetical protein
LAFQAALLIGRVPVGRLETIKVWASVSGAKGEVERATSQI